MTSTAVAILRWIALLAFGGPMLLGLGGRRRDSARPPSDDRGSRLPLIANLGAFALFFPVLIVAAGAAEGPTSLLLSVAGSLLAVAGSAVVLRSRAELGAAWSFVPMAGKGSGLVTTGLYGRVRHPLYLGLSMLAAGEALAFANTTALLVVLAAVIPTFVWRARVEEHLLARVFGDDYRRYRERTRMILPCVL